MTKNIFELARAALRASWDVQDHVGVPGEYIVRFNDHIAQRIGNEEQATAWLHDIAQLHLLELEPKARVLVGERFVSLVWLQEIGTYKLSFRAKDELGGTIHIPCGYYKMSDFLQRGLELLVQTRTFEAEFGIETKEVL